MIPEHPALEFLLWTWIQISAFLDLEQREE